MKTIKAIKYKSGAVVAIMPDGQKVFWPPYSTGKPDYRFRMVTVNCYRYRLEWVR